MWNMAADANGNPKLPGTNSCGGAGCRPLVTVNGDGSYTLNQEFYSMAQASKAIIPIDPAGPFGQRISVSVGGPLNWALRVGAYVITRVSSSDWSQVSIVVMNWADGGNPTPVTATIEFRGMQAKYTFPVGVTTLWWFAPAASSQASTTMEFIATTLGADGTTKGAGTLKTPNVTRANETTGEFIPVNSTSTVRGKLT